MATITYTQEDLDTLKEALVSGASSVTIGDRTVQFRSKKELLELIEMVKQQLDGDAAAASNTSIVVGGFSRKPDCGD